MKSRVQNNEISTCSLAMKTDSIEKFKSVWLKFNSPVHAVQPKLFTASEQVEISLFCTRHFSVEEKMFESIVSVLLCDCSTMPGDPGLCNLTVNTTPHSNFKQL